MQRSSSKPKVFNEIQPLDPSLLKPQLKKMKTWYSNIVELSSSETVWRFFQTLAAIKAQYGRVSNREFRLNTED